MAFAACVREAAERLLSRDDDVTRSQSLHAPALRDRQTDRQAAVRGMTQSSSGPGVRHGPLTRRQDAVEERKEGRGGAF